MKDIIKSKKFKIAAIVVGIIIAELVIFSGGVAVGFKKARFSYQWGEHYERNFMKPSRQGFPGFMNEMKGKGLRNAHGLSGNIISITDSNIVIKDQDGNEDTIVIADKTLIKSRGTDLKLSDLKAGDRVVILGRPSDNGVVSADLIRVFENNNLDGQN